MTREERIKQLARRIETTKEELSRTILRVSLENDLIPGMAMNLANLQRDLTELRILDAVYKGEI